MQDISISGISGRFPSCPTIADLKTGLLTATNLIQPHHRWPPSLNLPPYIGQIPDLDKFDANFFNTNPKQADKYDPKLRKLLEVVFEALIDAGLNPQRVRGTNTAVFLAVSPETRDSDSGSGLLTRSGAIMANTISFAFDFNGPSLAVDTACSSGLYVMDQAVRALRNGVCDMAVVCAGQTHLDPTQTQELFKMGVLNSDGKCKSFADDRNGYVKAEAVVALILQKTKDCRRIYAKVVGTGSNVDGFKPDGISHPSSEMQKTLLERIYQEYKIDRNCVTYVETHGPGTIVGDKQESESLGMFFGSTNQRKKPLLIGAVKSNLGHTETASGLTSIAKLCITVNSGVIPGNLHHNVGPTDIPEIRDGLLKVVTSNTPYEGGLLAIDAFGFGGANAHIVLQPNTNRYTPQIEPTHRLVTISGRTQKGVDYFLKIIEENRKNPEFLSLIDHIFNSNIPNHNYRGFTILGTNQEKPQIKKLTNSHKKRPLWFCFSGMGSQWPGMGKDLMKLPTFAATIKKCAKILEPYGLDLENIVVNGNEQTFEDVTNAFTGIVAVSVALVDLLKEMGVEADGIFGHSLGEIACGYADGSITAEQATLIAFARGYVSQQLDAKNSLMAAVGLPIQECQKLLPDNIAIACDNSVDNVTIAGPETSIINFLEKLKKLDVFCKIVPTGNIAFHCQNIKGGEKPLLEFLQKVIPEPKKRSKKWLSSSVKIEDYCNAEYNSAEYHTNNFLKQVRFRQVLQQIPSDAIILEIAPKGLLQAILRRNLPQTSRFHLVDEKTTNNLTHFFQTLGKLYLEGVELNLTNLYQFKNFPVAVNTPFLSNLVSWDHSRKWSVPKYNPRQNFGKKITIDLAEEEFEFLTGHVLNSQLLLPAAAYLVFTWKVFAEMHEINFLECPVCIENVKFRRAVLLKQGHEVELTVNIFQKSGIFEITSNEALVASGTIKKMTYPKLEDSQNQKTSKNDIITPDDFYKAFNLRGYTYTNLFRSVIEADLHGNWMKILWKNNWIAFIDAIFSHTLFFDVDDLWLPTSLTQITINPNIHPENINLLTYSKKFKMAECAGVTYTHLEGENVTRTQNGGEATLQKYEFVPESLTNTDFELSLRITLGIILENVKDNNSNLKIGILGEFPVDPSQIKNFVTRNIAFNPIITKINKIQEDNFDVIFLDNPKLKEILTSVNFSQFVYVKNGEIPENLAIIHKHTTKSDIYRLYKKKTEIFEYQTIEASNEQFDWVKKLQVALATTKNRIYLYSYESDSGIIGIYNTLRLEQNCQNLRIVHIASTTAPSFDPNHVFYKSQLEKDLTINVYMNDSWGTYRLLPLQQNKQILTDCAVYNHNNWISIPNSNLETAKVYYINNDVTNNFEFAGISKNIRIMGIKPHNQIVTQTDLSKAIFWEIPHDWSIEEGATVPLSYSLAYYTLFIENSIKSNDYLLVCQAGGNFITQAVIICALYANCQITALVQNNDEKFVLTKKFPKIDIRIYPSRDFFEKPPEGVTAIVNCSNLTDLKMFEKCALKTKPILIDLNIQNYIRNIFMETKDNRQILKSGIDQLLREKIIKPFDFDICHNISSDNNTKSDKKPLISILSDKKLNLPALKQTIFNREKSYIIVGGMGGVGIELANWMISRGVQKLILNGRRAPTTSYQNYMISKWRHRHNAQILIDLSKTQTITGARQLLQTAQDLGEIGGIFSTVLVLSDKKFTEMTETDFENVVEAKFHTLSNLDIVSNGLKLDYFVAFSSLACSIGNTNQTNYSVANFALERLCELRRANKMAGLAIEWGPIADVGYFANWKKRQFRILNAIPQSIQSCMDCLDLVLQQNDVGVVTSCCFGDDNYDGGHENNQKSIVDLILHRFGVLCISFVCIWCN